MSKPNSASPVRMENRGLQTGLALLFVVLPLAAPCVAQNGSPPFTTRSGAQHSLDQSPFDDDAGNVDPIWREKQLRALNADRQKEMVADANKLLKLVQDLNAEITTSNPDSLTPDQLRKIAEIEKLAHSVKEKMSTSVRGTTMYPLDPPPRMR
jgi:hypothetical protein